LISHHEGGRTTEDAKCLFSDIEKKRAPNSPYPIFVSDDWDPTAQAILEVYGIVETPEYKGIGRKPLPKLVPHPDLKYLQIIKYKKNDKISATNHRVIYGNYEEVIQLICPNKKDHVHTSYIERLNLTFRNSCARLIRETMNFSKDEHAHSDAIDFIQAWYNFIKPHESLDIEINLDMEEVGHQWRPKKWIHQTPAMVEMLTDHIWTMKELMSWRKPIL
jgi:hypothetical protein